MNFSGDNGLRQGKAGRLVVGMLLLAWLNVAAQPCLMAMELAPDKSVASEHAAHSEHGDHSSHASDSMDCGHCPPLAHDHTVSCETGSASNCEIFPGYNFDGRQFKQQAKDVVPQLALFLPVSTVDYSMAAASLMTQDTRRLKFTGDPPLNIRHCVFLK